MYFFMREGYESLGARGQRLNSGQPKMIIRSKSLESVNVIKKRGLCRCD